MFDDGGWFIVFFFICVFRLELSGGLRSSSWLGMLRVRLYIGVRRRFLRFWGESYEGDMGVLFRDEENN